MKNLLKSKRFLVATGCAALGVIAAASAVFANLTVVDMRPIGVAGTLKFEGSTTVGPIIDLAKTDYNSYRGSTWMTTANIIQKGSDYGKQGAILHYTDIGMTSSGLSSTAGSGDPANNFNATTNAAAQTQVLNTYPVARDGLCFIVNASVTDLSGTGTNITSITADQLWNIYTGHTTNWNQITDPITGVTGPNMTIVPRARVLGSGTRASWSDSIKNVADVAPMNAGLPVIGTDVDPGSPITLTTDPNYYTENNTIVTTGLSRGTGNVDIQGYINQSTTVARGQCGYVGLGFDTGSNIRDLKVYNKAMTVAYAPLGLNIYCNPGGVTPSYPFARFIYLCMPKWNETAFPIPFSTAGLTAYTNPADVTNFITWIQQTDGKGQDNVQNEGFLRLHPDQDVTLDNSVDVSDLVSVGAQVGVHGIVTHIRADVTRDGSVDVSDLVSVGGWVGGTVIPVP